MHERADMSLRNVAHSAVTAVRSSLSGWKTLAAITLIGILSLSLAPAAMAQVTYGGIQSSLTPTTGSWSGPVGVATDTSGNIYIGSYTSGYVTKINATTHATSTYISGTVNCGGTNITINGPQLIVSDSSNNLYIANQNTSQIIKWSTTTNACLDYYGAAGVFSIALDSSGNIWFGGGSTVDKIAFNAPNGTAGTIVALGFTAPNGLAFAPAATGGLAVGDLLVSDTVAGNIYKLTAASSYTTKTTLISGLNQPFQITFDSSNNLLVALTGTNNVVKYLASSNYGTSTPVLPYAKGAEGIGMDSSGDIFLTAYQGNAVTELCLSGNCINPVINVGSSSSIISVNFQIAAGTTVSAYNYMDQGITGSKSEFNAPSSDTNTALCTATTYATATVCDVDFVFSPTYPGNRYGAIQVLGASSAILNSVFVGGVGVGPEVAYLPGSQSTVGTSLTTPQGVGVDGFGNVYIVNTTTTGSITKVTAAGVQSTIACCTGLTPATLSNPGGIAVDGAGNVYVADYSNSRVVKIPWNGTTYGSAVQVLAGLSTPNDVAVDGNGNVYIANEGAAQILKVPWTGTTYGSSVVLESTNRVTGVAVDGNLNVYGAYYFASQVVKIPWNGSSYGTAVNVGSGWSGPFNLSVDVNGNLYVADAIANKVSVVPWNGTSYGTQYVVANTAKNGLGYSSGVSVDAAGDVFIADQTNNRIVKLSDGTPPTLTWVTTTPVGSLDSTDGAQTVTIQNIGNSPLLITVPSSGTNPAISAAYAYSNSSTCPQLTTSSSLGTLAQGANCTYVVNFTPTVNGTNSGTLALSDSNLNVSPSIQTINLTGTGIIPVSQIAISAVPAITVGGNVGSVTVSEENSSNAVVTSATDTITLMVTGPNSYTATYSVAAVAGVATFNLSGVSLPTAGTYTYTASVMLSGVSSVNTPGVVNKATPTAAVVPTPATIALLTSSSLKATLTGVTGVATPTGTVTFLDGSTTLGTCTLAAGTCSYTDATTAATTFGPHSITISYGGDTNYNTTTSTAATLTVVDFTLVAVAPTTFTILPGGTVVYSLTELPVGNTTFPNAIALTATGLPSADTLTLTPTPIAAGSGTTSFTLTAVTANSVNAELHRERMLKRMAPLTLALLLLPFAGRLRRRMPRLMLALLLALAGLAAAVGTSGCGNQPSGYFGHGVTNYTIVVTGTSGSLTHSTSVTLTVN